MKKKILGGLLVVAIAAVAAFNVNMNTDKNEMSLLALANVEALAEESNNQGSGMYYYTHLQGRPKSCTTYRHISVSGEVKYSGSSASLGAGWTSTKVSGMEESCPNSGSGCTVYSCHSTQ